MPPVARSAAGRPAAATPLPETRQQRLGDLHGVEGGTLAQVVARQEQREAVLRCRVPPDPPDERRVDAAALDELALHAGEKVGGVHGGQAPASTAQRAIERPRPVPWPIGLVV